MEDGTDMLRTCPPPRAHELRRAQGNLFFLFQPETGTYVVLQQETKHSH